MKNYRLTCLLGLLLLAMSHLNAQISDGGLPPSFSYQSLRSTISTERIPISFNVEDMKAVDEWRVSQGQPLKVATLIDTDLSIDHAGSWTTLPDGRSIWQVNIQAEGAVALMLYYKAFYIPEGGKLFIYNADKTQVIGAFTHRTNPTTDKFATEFVAGDDIILEYVAAPGGESPKLEIESIGYGYNHLEVGNNASLRSTASCYVSINCSEGSDWQTEKRGVCKMVERIGNDSYLCSGSLVNNTAGDFKPYILSAFHCSEDLGVSASAADFNQWVFYFNYERSGCDELSAPLAYQTMVGCSKKAGTAYEGGSDGLLLLLNQDIPDNYYVYYNGWDRRNVAATSGAGIHHPEGLYKKISTYSDRAISTTWLDEDSIQGAEDAQWAVRLTQTANGYGLVGGGSSGSPLFNQNKRVVGTLSGGDSSCDEPDGWALYGKLYCHWDKFGTDASGRMDVWLDPQGTGVEYLDGIYKAEPVVIEAPSDLQLTYANKQVLLTWSAPATQTPSKYNVYKNGTLLGTTAALTYTDTPSETGSIAYSVSAVYSDGTESTQATATLLVTDYKTPSDIVAQYTASQGIVVSWDAPLYQQTIYWGGGSTQSAVTFGGTPFYFGQCWSAEEIAPFYNKQLRGIAFVPVTGATYSILISQGSRQYTERITNPTYNKIHTIALQTPFTIGNDGTLLISIYVSKYSSNIYPACVDDGPAINGKGDLVSADGTTWGTLADSDLDANFFLAAIVTSENGTSKVGRQSASGDLVLTKSTLKAMVQKMSANDNQSMSSRPMSSQPAAFPEVTGYNVYRDGQRINASTVTETNYVDAVSGSLSATYGVSALYGDVESAQVTTDGTVVGTEKLGISDVSLSPTSFTDYVRIANAAAVRKLEILSIDGKLMKQVDNPGETVHTESLPKGLYLFRLTTDKDAIVVRGVKR